LDDHPEIVTDRLVDPGMWLRDQLGTALDSFFKDPYLLWFISEDAPRKNKLPNNIVALASLIIRKAKSTNAQNLQEQLDYTLKLVAWSRVARDCRVQLPLIKLLVEEGANMDGVSNDALVNGHFEAAEYIVDMGANLTLPTALCLGKWEQADKLAAVASEGQKHLSLVLAALNGKAEAVAKILCYDGIEVNQPCPDLYSHATALHHAVCSGSLETVECLVNAGARLDITDTVYNGTPLDWAVYGNNKKIEHYLRGLNHS
jgi:peptide-methionine (S)-S-oxide reductase